jgi:hypothetical protein
MLTERLYSQLRQPEDAAALPRPGVAGDPYGAVDRDRASVEVNVAPSKRPKLLGAKARHHRQDHVGMQTGISGG